MVQANDSVIVTPGSSGATIATHVANGKEYQAVMVAGPSGHIEGSLETYMLSIPPQAVASNKVHFDLFNGTGSQIIKIRGVWVVVAMDVAVSGLVALRLDWFRTSSVGTGGTAANYNSASIAPNITPKATTNAALPTTVARAAPTGGATSAAWLFNSYHFTEETSAATPLSQYNNVLPNPERGEQELGLMPNEGLKAVQGSVASVGSIGFLVSFTTE